MISLPACSSKMPTTDSEPSFWLTGLTVPDLPFLDCSKSKSQQLSLYILNAPLCSKWERLVLFSQDSR